MAFDIYSKYVDCSLLLLFFFFDIYSKYGLMAFDIYSKYPPEQPVNLSQQLEAGGDLAPRP
jgi:hypothetical protein